MSGAPKQHLEVPFTGDIHSSAPALYVNRLGLTNQLARLVWNMAWLLLFRPSPRACQFWRRGLLRLFGAKLARGVHVYPSVKIWAPWNLEMGESSCMGRRGLLFRRANQN